MKLCLIVTGTHLEKEYGNTVEEIRKDNIPITHMVPMELADNTSKGICMSMGRELKGMAEVFEEAKPDILILLGDRYEILMAAVVAMMFQIPIAHIHGGELTQGAIDDAIRHCVTKMSHLHFPATMEYKKRIVQMGENPQRVFHVGALGVENIRNLKLRSRQELGNILHPLFNKPYIMVTFHPVTTQKNSARKQMKELLSALKTNSQYYYVFTYANSDMEGKIINEEIDGFVKEFENCIAYQSMGRLNYLSALKYCCGVIGNSSSGIIEAPSFHVPTINIGERQKGRTCAKTVINCGYEQGEIKKAMEMIDQKEFLEQCKKSSNPYEKEGTSQNIIWRILDFLENEKAFRKEFQDIPFLLQ